MTFLKIHFYLFSQQHDIGSHVQFTQNCGYKSDDRIFSMPEGAVVQIFSSLVRVLAKRWLAAVAITFCYDLMQIHRSNYNSFKHRCWQFYQLCCMIMRNRQNPTSKHCKCSSNLRLKP